MLSALLQTTTFHFVEAWNRWKRLKMHSDSAHLIKVSYTSVTQCSLSWAPGRGLLEVYWGWTDAPSAGHLEGHINVQVVIIFRQHYTFTFHLRFTRVTSCISTQHPNIIYTTYHLHRVHSCLRFCTFHHCSLLSMLPQAGQLLQQVTMTTKFSTRPSDASEASLVVILDTHRNFSNCRRYR